MKFKIISHGAGLITEIGKQFLLPLAGEFYETNCPEEIKALLKSVSAIAVNEPEPEQKQETRPARPFIKRSKR